MNSCSTVGGLQFTVIHCVLWEELDPGGSRKEAALTESSKACPSSLRGDCQEVHTRTLAQAQTGEHTGEIHKGELH